MKTVMMLSPKDNNFYNFRRELICEMLRRGWRVVLVCPYGSKIDALKDDGCEFIDLPIDRRGTNPLHDLKLILRYCRTIRAVRPDIVLTYTSKSSIYGGIACRAECVKYIVNNAGLMEFEPEQKWLRRIVYALSYVGFRGAACMMYQNAQERDVLGRLLRGRVPGRLIPGSGVNLEEFAFCEYPPEGKIIFNYVARIVKIKGIDEFLQCAERVKAAHPDVEFRVYGDYDEDEYRAKIARMQERGVIRYCGVRLDMKPAIAECHAVIHPSYYEGMTNVVLEHSAMGRACIGSDIPGVREGIDDGATGFLFRSHDADAMTRAVEKFLALPYAEKAAMGRAARAKMEREFDRRIVTEAYLQQIERLTGEEDAAR